MLAQMETVSFLRMSLRIHVLQHTDTSLPGNVLEWLKTKGHASTIVRMHKGDALPTVDETDWLIVMGGSMNVDDVEAHPWLLEEKKLLKAAIAAKKTCFGICLGGQLLAQTLGATVQKHEHWEVGWHTVTFGAGAEGRLMVFQWHQDTFGLPEGECAEDKEWPEGPHVQTPAQLLEGIIFLTPLKKWLFELLNKLETITVQKAKA
ncbi:MAG: type 1 glutamine amidotransferase [Proteobacteria bacterium]|nr:MAG: type 1 glutamine amidotransferase [Pseudomonadota bacterium]